MKCSECGTASENIKEFILNFEIKYKDLGVYKSEFKRPLCKRCLRDNINMLNSDLAFERANDPKVKDNLDIFINDEFIKNS